MPLESATPMLNQSSIKNKGIRRRETIDTVRGRQHRTAFQQLQSMFWLRREPQFDEHEQIPMVDEKRSSKVQRTSSTRDNNQAITNENLNERQKTHRIQRYSDSMANI